MSASAAHEKNIVEKFYNRAMVTIRIFSQVPVNKDYYNFGMTYAPTKIAMSDDGNYCC